MASFLRKQETRPLSDVAFGKVELFFIYNLAGRALEKYAQNYGKNFPVHKDWFPAGACPRESGDWNDASLGGLFGTQ